MGESFDLNYRHSNLLSLGGLVLLVHQLTWVCFFYFSSFLDDIRKTFGGRYRRDVDEMFVMEKSTKLKGKNVEIE